MSERNSFCQHVQVYTVGDEFAPAWLYTIGGWALFTLQVYNYNRKHVNITNYGIPINCVKPFAIRTSRDDTVCLSEPPEGATGTAHGDCDDE